MLSLLSKRGLDRPQVLRQLSSLTSFHLNPCSPIELCHLPKVNPAIGFLQSRHGSFKFMNCSVHPLHVAECLHGLNFALTTLSRQTIYLSPSSSPSSSSPFTGTNGARASIADFFFSGATQSFLWSFQ
ncbi:hypothetical protein TrLO_g1802 [Triparma laevis f. longispina]|uniref:Uncharacterized protein n=1 Tax=Triparma laevis f. longispina TaxID=1714387 RepID=A0A9W7AAJ1_9STRA|nr:hypothetical protein TrLO_g1802 [Triparma laevis f. longispina]